MTRFFPDMESFRREVRFERADWLDAIESFLGRTVAQVARCAEHTSISDVDARMFVALQSRARIGLCAVGVAGDSGAWSPRDVFLMKPGSTEGLSDWLEVSQKSRLLYRRALGARIVSSPFFMSGAFAIDVGSVRVPFVPVLRNQDGVFGACIQRCSTSVLVAHLPFALYHSPPESRLYEHDAIWADGSLVRVADLLLAAIHSAPLAPAGAGSTEDRRHALGAAVTGLGAMRPRSFEEWARYVVDTGRAKRLVQLIEWSERERGASNAAKDSVSRQVSAVAKATGTPFGLYELEDAGVPRDESLRLAQSIVCRFGRLLTEWDAVVSAASMLKRQGIQLSRQISAEKCA